MTFETYRFHDHDQMKGLGAWFNWDVRVKRWYVPAGTPLEPFRRWLPYEHRSRLAARARMTTASAAAATATVTNTATTTTATATATDDADDDGDATAAAAADDADAADDDDPDRNALGAAVATAANANANATAAAAFAAAAATGDTGRKGVEVSSREAANDSADDEADDGNEDDDLGEIFKVLKESYLGDDPRAGMYGYCWDWLDSGCCKDKSCCSFKHSYPPSFAPFQIRCHKVLLAQAKFFGF